MGMSIPMRLIVHIKDFLVRIVNKSISHIELDPTIIYCHESDIFYFCLSANVINYIKTDKELLYFRECKLHSRANIYFMERIKEFFKFVSKQSKYDNIDQAIPIGTSFSPQYVEKFHKYILGVVNEPLLNKILNIDLLMKENQISIWGVNKCLSDEMLNDIGFSGLLKDYSDIAPLFCWYLKGVSSCYIGVSLIR